MWLRAAHGPEQHWGAEDGKLRVVLSAIEPDQMTDMGQDTVFEGELEFHEWGGTGDIKKEQYDAVKDWERPGPLRTGEENTATLHESFLSQGLQTFPLMRSEQVRNWRRGHWKRSICIKLSKFDFLI